MSNIWYLIATIAGGLAAATLALIGYAAIATASWADCAMALMLLAMLDQSGIRDDADYASAKAVDEVLAGCKLSESQALMYWRLQARIIEYGEER